MNININYDLIKTIENYYTKFTPFKLVKHTFSNNINADILLAGYTIRNLITEEPVKAIVKSLLIGLGVPTLISLYCVLKKEDPIKYSSYKKIVEIPETLNDMRIKTNCDLLKDTKVEKKEYSIRINENKIPQLIESKFFLIPSCGKNGEIKNTPLVQEHKMFTKKYILSKGK